MLAECDTPAPIRRTCDTPVASTPQVAALPPTNSAEPRVPTPADPVRCLHPESADHEDAACCAGRRAGGGVSLRQAVQYRPGRQRRGASRIELDQTRVYGTTNR